MDKRYIGMSPNGQWHSFVPKATLFATAEPQGWIKEDNIIPRIGDVFVLPSDGNGRLHLEKYAAALPSGLAFSPPRGMNDDSFEVVSVN